MTSSLNTHFPLTDSDGIRINLALRRIKQDWYAPKVQHLYDFNEKVNLYSLTISNFLGTTMVVMKKP